MDEEVLVFPSTVLERLGSFCGFSAALGEYLPTIFDPQNLAFMPRSRAEDDPRFKQLVAYCVICSGDAIYCYERGKKGTETRLHSLYSLGVGGHISRADGDLGRAAYDAGFAREIEEEIGIETTYTERIVGMIHDDRTPVGAVHFGIVHRFELAEPNVAFRDPALARARFRPLDDVVRDRDRFESWSAFIIDELLCAQSP